MLTKAKGVAGLYDFTRVEGLHAVRLAASRVTSQYQVIMTMRSGAKHAWDAKDAEERDTIVASILGQSRKPMADKLPPLIEYKPFPTFNNWEVLGSFVGKPFHEPVCDEAVQAHRDRARVVVKQHRDTGELRIDVFDCEGGLDVTGTNGGVEPTHKNKARWFRDVRTCREHAHPLTVRFMARGDGDNLELKS